MAKLLAYSIVKHSKNVVFVGILVLVEGQKEGQAYRFCKDLCHFKAVSIQLVYPLPNILEIVD